MANSKSIGNNYERQFSKELSAWITGDVNADICWRDTGSGTRATIRKKEGKETAYQGDIICTDLNYIWFFELFYIDTKSYKEFNSLIINPKNKKSNEIFIQWKKTIKNCPESKIPLMPCKIRSHIPEFIITPSYFRCNYENIIHYEVNEDEITYNFNLYMLEEFFRLNSPQQIQNLNLNF
jgi:hypothetical protein